MNAAGHETLRTMARVYEYRRGDMRWGFDGLVDWLHEAMHTDKDDAAACIRRCEHGPCFEAMRSQFGFALVAVRCPWSGCRHISPSENGFIRHLNADHGASLDDIISWTPEGLDGLETYHRDPGCDCGCLYSQVVGRHDTA